MNVWLGRCVTIVLWLAVLCTVAFASIRLATPWLAGQRDVIERLASAALARPVSIGAIDAAWHGLALDVRLNEVELRNVGGKVLLSFDEAWATPDLLRSLIRRRLTLASLHVTGARLHVIRANGVVTVRGIRRRQGSELDALADMSVSLRDSRIRWQDRDLDVDYRLRSVHATLETSGDYARLRARLALTGSRAARLLLAADLQGVPSRSGDVRGTFYLKGEKLPASRLPASLRARLTDATAALQIWGDVENGEIARVIGNADIDDVQLAGTSRFERVGMKLEWKARAHGWRTRIADLDVASTESRWRAAAAGLESRTARSGRVTYGGWLGNAKVQDLLAVLPRGSKIDAVRALIARTPAGELIEPRFTVRLKDGELQNYRAQGRFRDLRLAADAETPGFAGADGQFAFNRNSGKLALRSSDLEIEHPRLFATPLKFDRLRGHVRWRRENGQVVIQSPDIAISNKDFAANGPFELRVGAGQPYLDTQIALERGEVAKAADYLPVKTMSPKATEWLRQALVAGGLVSGGVRIKGEIANFPFRDGDGEFDAHLDVEQGILDYRPGWPRVAAARAEVRFRGPSVSATSTSARVLDSRIDAASVRIDDLREGELQLSLQGQGPAEDVARYLQRSILASSKVFERLALSGQNRLALDLQLPLDKDNGEKPKASGKVKFDGAGLRIVPPGIDFTDLKGELAFGPGGFRAEAIDARLRNRKVTADVAPSEDKRTIVTVRGRLPARTLLADFEHPLVKQLRGVSRWRARVVLPTFEKPPADAEPRPVGFSLFSSLRGTAVELPQPLQKRAAESRIFRVITTFGGHEQHPIRVQYGDDLSAVLALTGDANGMRIERGELRLARGPARLPRTGVTVKAALDEFSYTDWARWLQPGVLGDDGGAIPLRQLDVTARQLHWSGRTFDDLRLAAMRRDDRWTAQVSSTQGAGRVTVPTDPDSQTPLVADLEYLYLETGQNTATAAIDPRTLPPLRVTAKALRIENFGFNDVRLETSRLKDGMQVRKLELSAPNFEGTAQGAWRIGEGGHHSRFELVLDSNNLGELLRHWDLQHSVRDGIAHVEAQFAWPDAPARFDLAHLNGHARLRVTDGRLRELNPGPGRLLGLFNLGAIQRRLALDFSDLFRTGFSFDTMTGDLDFRDANMRTDNTVIDGPAALIKITGRTGLVAHDYDQRVVVVPKIMSGLPLAGALLGGPAVGAALFVAEKVIDELDGGINEADGILYTVTGPWNTPRIRMAKTSEQTRKPPKPFPDTIRK